MRQPRRTNESQPASPSPTGSDTPDLAVGETEVRARRGRRTVEERQQAVLELLAGKATLDQIARRLGVHVSTVEGWRQDALAGVEQALRRGSGKTPAELEFERKHRDLEKAFTQLSIQKCLLEQALDIERAKGPTGPARSKR